MLKSACVYVLQFLIHHTLVIIVTDSR